MTGRRHRRRPRRGRPCRPTCAAGWRARRGGRRAAPAPLPSPVPTTQRTASVPTVIATSRAFARLIAASRPASKRREAFGPSPPSAARAARRASAAAPSTSAASCPRRRRTCWWRVSRATRQASSSSASAWCASAATSAPIAGDARVQSLELARGGVVVVAARLEVLLPAVARDRHLHDLRRALVDRGDADVALDLLDHVLVRVAVAAERLDGSVGSRVARLGGEVLGDRALGVERSLAGVDALGGLLDRGARRLEAHGVGDDQLVGVALLLGERAAGLDALGGVRDRAVERRPPGAEPEGGDHQARVAEHLLGLDEALALDAADEPVGVDVARRRGTAPPCCSGGCRACPPAPRA